MGFLKKIILNYKIFTSDFEYADICTLMHICISCTGLNVYVCMQEVCSVVSWYVFTLILLAIALISFLSDTVVSIMVRYN
jgi:hypothetical protein